MPTKEQLEIYKRMTPAQKWKIVNDLYVTAWQMKAAGLRAQHPGWSETQIQEKVR